MDDHCEECRLYGSNYSYDEDGDIVSNCHGCPFEPYARGEEDDDTISRRAAIDAFAPYAEYESNRTNAEWVRRINMVLSALPSAQPDHIGEVTEMVGDNISRQAAIDTLKNRWKKTRNYEGIGDDIAEECELYLKQVPSAQPERKKGKWIERNPRNSPDCRLIECSECGNAYIVGYNINYDDWIGGRNFCMKCGADLRGGSNDKST